MKRAGANRGRARRPTARRVERRIGSGGQEWCRIYDCKLRRLNRLGLGIGLECAVDELAMERIGVRAPCRLSFIVVAFAAHRSSESSALRASRFANAAQAICVVVPTGWRHVNVLEESAFSCQDVGDLRQQDCEPVGDVGLASSASIGAIIIFLTVSLLTPYSVVCRRLTGSRGWSPRWLTADRLPSPMR